MKKLVVAVCMLCMAIGVIAKDVQANEDMEVMRARGLKKIKAEQALKLRSAGPELRADEDPDAVVYRYNFCPLIVYRPLGIPLARKVEWVYAVKNFDFNAFFDTFIIDYFTEYSVGDRIPLFFYNRHMYDLIGENTAWCAENGCFEGYSAWDGIVPPTQMTPENPTFDHATGVMMLAGVYPNIHRIRSLEPYTNIGYGKYPAYVFDVVPVLDTDESRVLEVTGSGTVTINNTNSNYTRYTPAGTTAVRLSANLSGQPYSSAGVTYMLLPRGGAMSDAFAYVNMPFISNAVSYWPFASRFRNTSGYTVDLPFKFPVDDEYSATLPGGEQYFVYNAELSTEYKILKEGDYDLLVVYGYPKDENHEEDEHNMYYKRLSFSVAHRYPQAPTSAGNASKDKFNVYPNPAVNSVNISSPGKGSVKIINSKGQTVFTAKEIPSAIDVSSYANDIYTAVISPYGEAPVTKKIIKK